jgi:hypothetical protein
MTSNVSKLEQTVAGWLKKVPHLPESGQKWLAENIWWITLVGAIISSISVLFGLVGLFSIISVLSSVAVYAYAIGPVYTGWTVVTALVSLLLLALSTIVLWVAVKPLQEKTKKGWTILFIALLVEAASVIIDSVLSLNPFGIISGLIFGAIGIAIGAYFIFEIRGQFAHQTKAAAKPVEKKA